MDPLFEILRDWGDEGQRVPCDRMDEAEAVGMEHLPISFQNFIRPFAAIGSISQYRVADMFEMDANLMGTPCFGADESQTDLFVKSQYLDLRDGFFSRIGHDSHFFAFARMAPDRGGNRCIWRTAQAEGQIGLFHLP